MRGARPRSTSRCRPGCPRPSAPALVAGLDTIIANLSAAETARTRTHRPAAVGKGNRMTAPGRKAVNAAAEEAPHAPRPSRGPAGGGGRRRLLIAAVPLALALGGGYVWATGGRYVAHRGRLRQAGPGVGGAAGERADRHGRGRRERRGRGRADALHHRRRRPTAARSRRTRPSSSPRGSRWRS